MATMQETKTTTVQEPVEEHFNNWSNVKGFDANFEQKTPVELAIKGHIPTYAAGVLYRTGPGACKVDAANGETLRLSHWFDGFSEAHRFQLIAPDKTHPAMRVFYNSRFSTDDIIEQARQTGKFKNMGFGQKRDPCQMAYHKVQTEYEPVAPPTPASINVGVTLSINMPGVGTNGSASRWDTSTGIKTLTAKTDFNVYKHLDPETLEPISLARQQDFHPDLDGFMTAAHARSDPNTGDLFNFNLTVGPVPAPTYRVFCVSASTGETTVLATFPGTPAYIHSLFLSEDYVVLCVWNTHVSHRDLNSSVMDCIKPFDPSKPATWYVVDRKTDRGLVATYESPAFFSFHTINSWQETTPTGETDIVADLIMFENLDFMHRLYYENLLSDSLAAKAICQGRTDASRSTITRFRLSAIPATPNQVPLTATIESSACKALSPELPTMNPNYVTRKHRYVYGVADRDDSTFFDGIMKFDNETKESLLWAHNAQSPGEPVFVADPDAANEDDGVLLSVVLDGFTGKSYLLCLDAHNLAELGRASVDGPVAFGFHGQHVPTRGLPTGDY
ncbi:putative dioxygenase [Aspergillus ellipticus CBS 707.79]|uniref:Putative dioxygenase n=1 Tax=Aspergillus ellipticus CBS 707.79 TaxID=1448320 RepID=A0A319ERN2_9EURO|nr:putative dioxygenase [Aspergillus ellipticus CBS 707.79]